MGNRAIICFEDTAYVKDKATGHFKPKGKRILPFAVYLHWNGGPESVHAFLAYANERFKERGNDISYFAARFTEFTGRFMENSVLSLGIIEVEPASGRAIVKGNAAYVDSHVSHGDNGVYVIGWKETDAGHGYYAVTRRFACGDTHPFRAFTPTQIAFEHADALCNVRYKGVLDATTANNAPHPGKEDEEAA